MIAAWFFEVIRKGKFSTKLRKAEGAGLIGPRRDRAMLAFGNANPRIVPARPAVA